MDMSPFPLEAHRLLPHAGAMCCIDSLRASTKTMAVAEVVLARGHSLLDGDTLAPAGYVELAAQTVGAMQGFYKQRQNLPPQSGYLVGAQDFTVFGAATLGDRLEVEVHIEAEFGEMTVLTTEVRRGETMLAAGRLKVYVPES
jgi:predicted hotdog family 3-hydroxylacyl-ACP dehydratase